ncbi:Transporter substrate-binding domain-containing protein [Rhodovastum atsumiense]|uniref:Transporter substrate-binding domain-containing protein n=1 Tax=Rhodovastum atsumiense TaxID=504468 RepID=A0A5M6IUS5_9PROT|nr:NrtA/SsuA/CpmA family ABC transporter substrate-binding protein [Rhodovastum atsumiense]KAA5612050.1 transporter substrate-binding domain-containing protein [Rhodovastum atsumiense]CAH2604083.1 Transporter substrate-binding domain-containing protein [Rhodovastum atsumiense]
MNAFPHVLSRRGLMVGLGVASLSGLRRPGRAAQAFNVSYVRQPFNVPQIVMRERQLLEQRLRPLGFEVVWHDITSGVLQAQALAAGSLDIGAVMNPASVIMALANGNPLRITGAVARNRKLAAILTRDPRITRVADLKGRTVAGVKGTALHQYLIAALQDAGLSIGDVAFLDMQLPVSLAALQSGQVDAAVLAADLILAAQRQGAREVPTRPGLLQPVTITCARADLVAQRPDLVRLYQQAQAEAVAFVAADPDAAIRIACKANGFSLEDGRTLYSWAEFHTRLTPADLESLERDMAFLIENRMCPRPVDLRAALFEAT